jgi:hypothetical protein
MTTKLATAKNSPRITRKRPEATSRRGYLEAGPDFQNCRSQAAERPASACASAEMQATLDSHHGTCLGNALAGVGSSEAVFRNQRSRTIPNRAMPLRSGGSTSKPWRCTHRAKFQVLRARKLADPRVERASAASSWATRIRSRAPDRVPRLSQRVLQTTLPRWAKNPSTRSAITTWVITTSFPCSWSDAAHRPPPLR